MGSGHLLIVLAVAAVTLVAVAVLRRRAVPAAVVLVAAGLVIGFLPFVPDATLPPEAVLLGLLPLLVFDAAVTSSPTAFRRDFRSIGLLAVGLVVVSAGAVAAVAHLVAHLSWPVAFVLGTAVGPTDASAAISIVRRLGLPRRVLTILEGEALFNDATALVLYAAAVSATREGSFSVSHTAASIVYAAVVGALVGLIVGRVGRWLRARMDDPLMEIAGSILLAYGAYLPAEALRASGVLAAVVAGLYLGWHTTGGAFSARSRLQSAAFWEALVFLINAALFVLVGLSFHSFSAAARGPAGRLVITAVLVVLTVILVRLTWMESFSWALRSSEHSRDEPRPDWRVRVVLGWSGMRGAITLAALLAVPEATKAGQPVAGRDDTIYLGFAVIIATLIGQGLSLPFVVRRLGLAERPPAAAVVAAERHARLHIARVARDHLDDAELGEHDRRLVDGLRAEYDDRVHRLEAVVGDDDLVGDTRATANVELALRLALLSVQRRSLTELRDQGRIGTTTMRTIQHSLDLEEARLFAAAGPPLSAPVDRPLS